MTGKLFIIENGNLESSNVSLSDIQAKLDDTMDFVIGQKLEESSPSFGTLEDFALFLARKIKLLKNDRVLFMSEEESYEMIFLILRQIYKNKTGDSEFPVSEILDVYRKLGQSESSDFDSGIVNFAQMAKAEYLDNLKKNNLVDSWTLAKLFIDNDILISEKNTLFVLKQKLDGPVKKLFKTLFEKNEQVLVQIEVSLDSSLTGNVQDFSLHLEKFNEQIECRSNTQEESSVSNTEKYCKLTMTSHMKLLLNSKDELSLAKIICSGPEAIIEQKDFHVIKEKSGSMPMYQTIVSYAAKLQLGGKSYAPTEDHAFFNFSKELVDFSNFMNKLHDKLEDEPTGEKALINILKSLKSHLMKTLRQSSVETVIDEFLEIFKSSLRRWTLVQVPGDDGKQGKPQIPKMMLLMIDALSTSSCHFSGNINKMFGKIESDSVSPLVQKSTPIVCPRITSLFKTPVVEEEKPKEEEEKLETKVDTPKKAKDGMSKFTSSLAWADETSPLILQSNERNLKTEGATLAMSAESSTPKASRVVSKVIQDGMKAAEEALKDAKAAPKPPKSKLSKRSILTDIKNVDKWSKREASEDKKRKLEDLNGEENAPSKKKNIFDMTGEENASVKTKKPTLKQSSKKKQPVLLKGQMKMTAFLRV